MDGLDRESVMRAVTAAAPDVIVHQMTALTGDRLPQHRQHVRDHEPAADRGHRAPARRRRGRAYAASSPSPSPAGRTRAPAARSRPRPTRSTPTRRRASARPTPRSGGSRRSSPAAGGIVLRYGGFYGPGTGLAPGGDQVEMIRKRKFPLVGNGGGYWSFVHTEDVATAHARGDRARPRGRDLQHRRRRARAGARVAAVPRALPRRRARRAACPRGSRGSWRARPR